MDTCISSMTKKVILFLAFLIMVAMAFLSEIEMPIPEATPKPTGFELVFAVIALMVAAYLVKRSECRKDMD